MISPLVLIDVLDEHEARFFGQIGAAALATYQPGTAGTVRAAPLPEVADELTEWGVSRRTRSVQVEGPEPVARSRGRPRLESGAVPATASPGEAVEAPLTTTTGGWIAYSARR